MMCWLVEEYGAESVYFDQLPPYKSRFGWSNNLTLFMTNNFS